MIEKSGDSKTDWSRRLGGIAGSLGIDAGFLKPKAKEPVSDDLQPEDVLKDQDEDAGGDEQQQTEETQEELADARLVISLNKQKQKIETKRKRKSEVSYEGVITKEQVRNFIALLQSADEARLRAIFEPVVSDKLPNFKLDVVVAGVIALRDKTALTDIIGDLGTIQGVGKGALKAIISRVPSILAESPIVKTEEEAEENTADRDEKDDAAASQAAAEEDLNASKKVGDESSSDSENKAGSNENIEYTDADLATVIKELDEAKKTIDRENLKPEFLGIYKKQIDKILAMISGDQAQAEWDKKLQEVIEKIKEQMKAYLQLLAVKGVELQRDSEFTDDLIENDVESIEVIIDALMDEVKIAVTAAISQSQAGGSPIYDITKLLTVDEKTRYKRILVGAQISLVGVAKQVRSRTEGVTVDNFKNLSEKLASAMTMLSGYGVEIY